MAEIWQLFFFVSDLLSAMVSVYSLYMALSHLFPYQKPNKKQSVVTDFVTTWPGNPKQGQNSPKLPKIT